ncbi:hypothetical protein EZV62_009158 [Acer yangbiense]|uniref:FBD domain-containing protein n=1 Tax=Acer yangbiense TaxID=1000413 RepID=A0A5C7IF82_9ROSI|nr:hypothetical protein EZV62_009158 [Acer yangbiense]
MNSLQNLFMDLDRQDDNLKVEQCCHALSKMLKRGVCNVKALNVSGVFLEANFRNDFPFMSKDHWKMPNMPNETTSCLKYHLKIVEIFHVRDDKHEFDLVKFFLKNGHILQKMRISLVHGHRNTDKIITEIMKFPRSSSNLALTFVKPFHISLDGKSYGCFCNAYRDISLKE